jgi:hypothetical protein
LFHHSIKIAAERRADDPADAFAARRRVLRAFFARAVAGGRAAAASVLSFRSRRWGDRAIARGHHG